ncbi:MAG: zinc ribbon domain-containing protein [Gammaproteobacteria bacterium]|jgi:putative FmdB family regulatory protein|nr:MAG: zinc ribbon domain-containing protein [Gammaproteobacteria bacterium]
MPIYEYQCSQCDNRLEVIQKFSDPPLTDCPECGTGNLRKLISAAAFHLKGTGWYVTDFRDKSKKNAPAASSDKKDVAATDKDAASGAPDKDGKSGATEGTSNTEKAAAKSESATAGES